MLLMVVNEKVVLQLVSISVSSSRTESTSVDFWTLARFARLDRALCNDRWRVAFPNSFVKVLPRIDFSDHHLILVYLDGNINDRREKPFRFESAWLTHPSFKNDMKGWSNNSSNIATNLRRTEQELGVWRHTTFGCVRAKKRNLIARIGGIQKRFHDGTANRHLFFLEKELQKELNVIL